MGCCCPTETRHEEGGRRDHAYEHPHETQHVDHHHEHHHDHSHSHHSHSHSHSRSGYGAGAVVAAAGVGLVAGGVIGHQIAVSSNDEEAEKPMEFEGDGNENDPMLGNTDEIINGENEGPGDGYENENENENGDGLPPPPPDDNEPDRDDVPPEDMNEAVDMYGAAEPRDDDFNKRDDFDNGKGVSVTINIFDTMSKINTSNNGVNGEMSDYSDNSDVSDIAIDLECGTKRDLYEMKPFWRKSSKNRELANMVTIVTQCSLDRLIQLNNMCLMWDGIISVSVYVPNGEKAGELSKLESLFDKVESDGSEYKCVLDIHLLCCKSSSHSSQWYPINTLRNLSLNNSSSEYLFLLDIDFIPSKNLQSNIMNAVTRDLIRDNNKNNKFALVIPAFEYQKNILSVDSINDYPLTKPKLMRNKADICGFHLNSFKFGHFATNYDKWFASDCGRSNIYSISYQMYYEPYIVVRNDSSLRRYDERFTGYGFNKIIHIAGLSIVDEYKFYVLKNGFVVSPIHSKSKDFIQTYRNSNTKESKKRKMHLSKLATIAFNEMYAT